MEKWGGQENPTAELLEALFLKELSMHNVELVNWGRLVLMAPNMDLESGPDIVTDFRWWTEDNWLVRRF